MKYVIVVLTHFVLLCFVSLIVLCLLTLFEPSFLTFSIDSINAHKLLGKRQLGLILKFRSKDNEMIHIGEECYS